MSSTENPSYSHDESNDDSLTKSEDEGNINGIPGELEPARCRVNSVRELFHMMTNNAIELELSYHRGMVWSQSAQSFFIDSIFKGAWNQTLLFSERIVEIERMDDEDGSVMLDSTTRKQIWVCVDGKERMNSINLFLSGKIPWIRQPGKQLYFRQSDPPTPSRSILSAELQDVFLRRGIITALYHNLTEVQERDMFRTIRVGKPMTIGEKIQVASGTWAHFLEELTQTYMVQDKKHPNGWSPRIVRKSGGTLQKQMIALQETPVTCELENEVRKLLDVFMSISLLAPPGTPHTAELKTPEAIFAPIKKGRKSMISSVEMVWIPCLISHHVQQLSLGELLELIELLKVDIRLKYPKNIKNNKDVTSYIFNWITSVDLGRLRGKYNGHEVPQKRNSYPAEPPSPPAIPQPRSSFDYAELQDENVEGDGFDLPPMDPQPSKESKRKTGVVDDNVPMSSTTAYKRSRISVPHPCSTSQTADETSEENCAKRIDRPDEETTCSLGNNVQPSLDVEPVGQSRSLDGSFTRQFLWRGGVSTTRQFVWRGKHSDVE